MNLCPTEFMTDYEASMRLSIKTIFPNAIIRGCWFHYKRALQMKCAKLGLKAFMNKNDEAKIILKKLENLPLLNSTQIRTGFDHIRAQAEVNGILEDLTPLFKYFEQYWLRRVSTFSFEFSHNHFNLIL